MIRRDYDAVAFGCGLAELMRREEITCLMLGEWVGVNHATVSLWRNGRVLPREANVSALEEIFRVSAEEIVRIGEEIAHG